MNRIKEAFSEIKAEDELIQSTLQVVTRSAARKKPRSLGRVLGLAAGAVCAFVLLATGTALLTTPTASVSMDVNPSIELSLNCFDRVLAAIPKNKDAEYVLSGLNLKNETYTKALQSIVAMQQELGYMSDGSDVVFAVQSDNTAQQEKLMQASLLYANSVVGQQHTACYAANDQDWTDARQYGISPGKYMAIQELQEYDSAVTVDEYAHHSMRDIRQEIQHHQTGDLLQNSDSTGSGPNNANGQGQQGGGANSGNDVHGQGDGSNNPGNGNGNHGNGGPGNNSGNGHHGNGQH
ncbi:MAG: anti-sigma-I factor RsgI family protein [Christensenellaceae bacterium]